VVLHTESGMSSSRRKGCIEEPVLSGGASCTCRLGLPRLISVIRAASDSTVAVEGPGSPALSAPEDTAGENIPMTRGHALLTGQRQRREVSPAAERWPPHPMVACSSPFKTQCDWPHFLVDDSDARKIAPPLPPDDAAPNLEPPPRRYIFR
jgi:hypothetical protein